jgi:hypothetical protein
MIEDVPAEIQTEHFKNKSLGRYPYTTLLTTYLSIQLGNGISSYGDMMN